MAIALVAKDQRVALAGPAQQVLGKIEPGIGEEARTRHLVAINKRALAFFTDNAAEIPDELPEIRAVRDRPGVQCAKVLKLEPVSPVGLGAKGGELALGHALGSGPPQRLGRGARWS